MVGIVAYMQIKNLLNKKMKKEIIIYSVFLGVASSLFIVELMQLSIPNPLEGIRFIFEPVGKSIESLLTKGG